MNITCNIIKNLLPLYAEDMVSEDSKALVDDHLCSCDSCTKELAELKKAPKVPVEVETSSLKRVEDTIRKRKLLTAVTAVLTLAAVLVTGTIFLMPPVYLTARQAIEGVELRDDGGLAIDYASGIMGYGSTSFGSEDDEFFWCHTTRYDWLRSKLFGPKLSKMTQEELERYVQANAREEESFQQAWDRILKIHLEYGTWKTPKESYFPNNLTGDWELVSRTADKNVWFVNPFNPQENTLIWNGAQKDTEGVYPWINHTYLILFGSCTVLTGALWLIAQKRTGRMRLALIWVALLSGCIAVSILLVTGGCLMVTGNMASYKWPGMIVVESLTLALTLGVWRQLHVLNNR